MTRNASGLGTQPSRTPRQVSFKKAITEKESPEMFTHAVNQTWNFNLRKRKDRFKDKRSLFLINTKKKTTVKRIYKYKVHLINRWSIFRHLNISKWTKTSVPQLRNQLERVVSWSPVRTSLKLLFNNFLPKGIFFTCLKGQGKRARACV